MTATDDPLNRDDRLHLRILLADRLHIDRTWEAPEVCSSFWRLYLNDDDGAELLLPGRRRHALTADVVHLVPAWVRFSSCSRARVGHLFVHFDLIGLPGAVTREVFPRPIALPPDAAILAACRALGSSLEQRRFATMSQLCLAKAAVFAALAPAFAILPAGQEQRCLGLVGDDRPILAALHLIEDNLGQAISNDRLARACHLAKDHFIRRFREHVGQTPIQYVLERRIAAAAQRLLFSSDSIDEVAAAYGFPNRYYFTRAFSKRMGVPPAAYRRSSRV